MSIYPIESGFLFAQWCNLFMFKYYVESDGFQISVGEHNCNHKHYKQLRRKKRRSYIFMWGWMTMQCLCLLLHNGSICSVASILPVIEKVEGTTVLCKVWTRKYYEVFLTVLLVHIELAIILQTHPHSATIARGCSIVYNCARTGQPVPWLVPSSFCFNEVVDTVIISYFLYGVRKLGDISSD